MNFLKDINRPMGEESVMGILSGKVISQQTIKIDDIKDSTGIGRIIEIEDTPEIILNTEQVA